MPKAYPFFRALFVLPDGTTREHRWQAPSAEAASDLAVSRAACAGLDWSSITVEPIDSIPPAHPLGNSFRRLSDEQRVESMFLRRQAE